MRCLSHISAASLKVVLLSSLLLQFSQVPGYGQNQVSTAPLVYKPIPRCEVLLGARSAEINMRLMGWGTDRRTVGRIDKVDFRSTRPGNGTLVFDVADTLTFNRNGHPKPPPLYVTVEYLDVGSDKFRLKYDSASTGPLVPLKSRPDFVITKSDSRTWKKAAFTVRDAGLMNRAPAGGDFVIDDLNDGKESIRRFSVAAQAEGPVRGRLKIHDISAAGVNHQFVVPIEILDENDRRLKTFSGTIKVVSLSQRIAIPQASITVTPQNQGMTSVTVVSQTVQLGKLQQFLGFYADEDPLISTFQETWPPRPRKYRVPSVERFWDKYRIHVFMGALAILILFCLSTIRWRSLPESFRSGRYIQHLRVAVLFTIITVVMTFPHVFVSYGALPDVGDSLFIAWCLNHDLTHLSSNWSYFFDANIFYPQTNTFAYSEHMLSMAILAAPVYALTGNIAFTYQTLQFLGFFLSAFAMYWYAYYLSRNRPAAIIAGCFYGFYAIRISQLCHLQINSTQFIPFCFYYLHRYLRENQVRYLGRFALVLTFQMLVSGYLAVMLTYTVAAYGAVLLITTGAYKRPKVYASLALAAIVIGLMLYPMFQPYLQDRHTQRSLGEASHFGLHLEDLFNRAPNSLLSPLIPDRLENSLEISNRGGTKVFVGFIASFLGIVGLLAIWVPARLRVGETEGGSIGTGSRLRLDLITAGLLLIISVLVAVGAGDKSGSVISRPSTLAVLSLAFIIVLAIRAAIGTKDYRLLPRAERHLPWISIGFFLLWILCLTYSMGPAIRLGKWQLPNVPFRAAFEYLPGVGQMRVPSRIWAVGAVAWGILIALGAARLLVMHQTRKRNILAGVLCVGLLAENCYAPLTFNGSAGPEPGYNWLSRDVYFGTSRPAVCDWLASRKDIYAVAALPFPGIFYDIRHMYNSMFHGKQIMNGYSGYFPPNFAAVRRTMLNFPDPASLQILREHRVTDVLVHKDYFQPGTWEAFQKRMQNYRSQIITLYQDQDSYVFRIIPKRVLP